MTRQRIAEIRARCEAATPGPWMLADSNKGTEYPPMWEITNDAFHNPPADEDAPWLAIQLHTGMKADAELVVAAWTDIPDLLDALTAALDRVEDLEGR